ncbi:MAG: hypothetical protein KKF62_18485 [Bacteroidetes bacterium]|nr:hypothetical protein [Bacteroidota bacterium]MBU1114372.1 hypothetical protein [Bacteroidota bacterium]MBU1798333.1 hypothetical protein [Bacteroidota bacterium]
MEFKYNSIERYRDILSDFDLGKACKAVTVVFDGSSLENVVFTENEFWGFIELVLNIKRKKKGYIKKIKNEDYLLFQKVMTVVFEPQYDKVFTTKVKLVITSCYFDSPSWFLENIKLSYFQIKTINLELHKYFHLGFFISILSNFKNHMDAQTLKKILKELTNNLSYVVEKHFFDYHELVKSGVLIRAKDLTTIYGDDHKFWHAVSHLRTDKVSGNRKYTNEMFEHTDTIRNDFSKITDAYMETLVKFDKDPLDFDSYRKGYNSRFKKKK